MNLPRMPFNIPYLYGTKIAHLNSIPVLIFNCKTTLYHCTLKYQLLCIVCISAAP